MSSGRTAFRFSGIGVCKKKEQGTLDNGTPWRTYEVAFEDCRRRFKLSVNAFEVAPEVDELVEISGRIETDGKARDCWVLEKLQRVGVTDFAPSAAVAGAIPEKRKSVL